MKQEFWITANGQLPAIAKKKSFDEAVHYVCEKTGEHDRIVRENCKAGCPTIDSANVEWDIEMRTV